MDCRGKVLLYDTTLASLERRVLQNLVATKEYIQENGPIPYPLQHEWYRYGVNAILNYQEFYQSYVAASITYQQSFENLVAAMKMLHPFGMYYAAAVDYPEFLRVITAPVNNAGCHRRGGVLSPLLNENIPKQCDDADLDLAQILREAEQYNDCGILYQKLNSLSEDSLLDHILFYLGNSYCKLTVSDIFLFLSVLSQNKPITIFDQLSWFGYNCLINSNYNDKNTVTEYSKIMEDIVGKSAKDDLKAKNDLAVEFALNTALSDKVIAACDKHFEVGPRKRMAYTQMFQK